MQSILDNLHLALLALGLNSYTEENTDKFGEIIEHPTEQLIAAPFYIGNIAEWDNTISEAIQGYELSDLHEDWAGEI